MSPEVLGLCLRYGALDVNHQFEVVDLYASELVERFCNQAHKFHMEGVTPPPEFDLDLTEDNKLRVIKRPVADTLAAVGEDGRRALQGV